MRLLNFAACCFAASLAALSMQSSAETLLETNENAARRNLEAANESQKKVDSAYEKRREDLQQFRVTQTEIDQLSVYNKQLQEIIGNQNTQLLSLQNQIKEIEVTQQGIMPLMERMLNGLQQFVQLDTPFLIKEREERVANLRALLLSANITVSEKFRRVLEAFQIEVEYGRTIEAYRAENSNKNMVDFLRVGRVALYYLPLSGSQAHVWSKKNLQWVLLDSQYDRAILKGIRIARKQSAPSLLNLQLPGLGAIQ